MSQTNDAPNVPTMPVKSAPASRPNSTYHLRVSPASPVSRSSRKGADSTGVKYRKRRHHAMQITLAAAVALATSIAGAGVADAGAESIGLNDIMRTRVPTLIRIGHDNVEID